ncbi:Crp/Fnr family transcriptional regulator [Clostridia bacterium]|nr:Crp/Fnr family transcriptional regulator [Clostridia bacterium]
MKNIFPLLNTSPLFAGINSDDFDSLLTCLSANLKSFNKEETIYFEGDMITEIGICINGRLHLVKVDVWGNRSIVAEIKPPDMFTESVVCSGTGRIFLNVVAKETSQILFIDYKKIISTYSSCCAFQGKLIHNMIGILARKNLNLASKMEYITKRTIREKLLSYLSDMARQQNSKTFFISFNRQELADYLAVDRSALSAEMSKLKAQGYIDYKKNYFELLREVTQ